MKKGIRLIVSLMLIVTLLTALSVNVFAARMSFKATASRDCGPPIVNVTCDYHSLKKDSVTIKNIGTSTLRVHINNQYEADLYPGQSYTSRPSHRGKEHVKIYELNGKYDQTSNLTITTTSGKIINKNK